MTLNGFVLVVNGPSGLRELGFESVAVNACIHSDRFLDTKSEIFFSDNRKSNQHKHLGFSQIVCGCDCSTPFSQDVLIIDALAPFIALLQPNPPEGFISCLNFQKPKLTSSKICNQVRETCSRSLRSCSNWEAANQQPCSMRI